MRKTVETTPANEIEKVTAVIAFHVVIAFVNVKR